MSIRIWRMRSTRTRREWHPDLRVRNLGGDLYPASSYTHATLLNVTYDGKHVSYWIAGALVRSVPITGLGPLFGQLCFYSPGDSAVRPRFQCERDRQMTPFTLVPMSINGIGCGGHAGAFRTSGRKRVG